MNKTVVAHVIEVMTFRQRKLADMLQRIKNTVAQMGLANNYQCPTTKSVDKTNTHTHTRQNIGYHDIASLRLTQIKVYTPKC
jgi:beta-glucosidase-like glycosyl hydrolase